MVRALAQMYSILMDRKIDPFNEILVTAGAMQSLSFVAKAFLNPGEEVILFEPYYQAYQTIIRLAGGVPVFVPFRTANGKKAVTSSDLTFNETELESKFSGKPKMIWVNNPNNPTGKVSHIINYQNISLYFILFLIRLYT